MAKRSSQSRRFSALKANKTKIRSGTIKRGKGTGRS